MADTPQPLVESLYADPNIALVMQFAVSQNGVMEDPKMGNNQGPQVNKYLQAVGLNPAGNPPNGYAWCAAFVYWCYQQAALQLNLKNPCVKTAGVQHHWDTTTGQKILAADALADHTLILPGDIFCHVDDKGGHHTGMVINVGIDHLISVEGNTNQAGSREGNSVQIKNTRTFDYVTLGFIRYAGMFV